MKRDEDISISEIFEIFSSYLVFLKSKWRQLFLAILLGIITASVICFFKNRTPLYTAELTFVVEDGKSSNNISNALGLASSLGIDLGANAGGVFEGGNLLELIVSRKIIERTLLSKINGKNPGYTLAQWYIDSNLLKNKEVSEVLNEKKLFLAEIEPEQLNIDTRAILGKIYQSVIKKIDVQQGGKKSSIIHLKYSSQSESFAKTLLDTLIKQVSSFYVETKSHKAKLNVEILEKKVDSIKAELNSSLSQVASINDQTFNLNPALNINRVPSTRGQIDVQANTAILTQLVQNLELSKLTLMKETPLVQIIDEPIIPLANDKLSYFSTGIKFALLFLFLMSIFLAYRKWKTDTQIHVI